MYLQADDADDAEHFVDTADLMDNFDDATWDLTFANFAEQYDRNTEITKSDIELFKITLRIFKHGAGAASGSSCVF